MDINSQSILLAALGYKGASAKVELLKNVTDEQWTEVVELANRHRVTPLLYHNLKSLNRSLPEDIEFELKEQFLKQSFRNIFLFQEMDKLLELFQDRKIPVIVLKGAYLARVVYENIGLRGMSDIDLLVKKEDLLRAEEVVLGLKGEPEQHNRIILDSNAHFGYKLPGQGIRVEVHWSIISDDIPFLVDVEGLWNRAQPLAERQINAVALSPEDLLLHLCLHSAKHTYDLQVRMLCDIGEVLSYYREEIDWQMVADRAELWGVCRALYVFLSLARELLKADVPLDIIDKMRPNVLNEHHLEFVRQQIFKEKGDVVINNELLFAALLRRQKSLADKFFLVRDRLLLSKKDMATRYPAPAYSWRLYLFYFLRLHRLLKRYSLTLLRLALGYQKTKDAVEQTDEIAALRDWLISG